MSHHSCDLRKSRVSVPGQIYLVTTVTKKLQQTFKDFQNARFVINSLRYVTQTRHVESLCYVIMPDHLHWLFSLHESHSLQHIINSVKRYSAYRINQHNKKTGSAVWQPGFHDYALRKEEIKDIARYVVANPLREIGRAHV